MEARKICSKGIWDDTIPGIEFDENGVSNYCKMQESLMRMYPQGSEGEKKWEEYVKLIRKNGKNKKYDCVIGISGGTDSSYLLHLAKQYELRPLAVNLDNGWNSDIAIKNIKKITDKLDIDLETYVIDYEEVKTVLKSYILAGLPWIDSPSDMAIKATMYHYCIKENIKYVLNGADFRTEGKQPLLWTYSDAKQLNHLVKKFFNIRLKSFPYLSFHKLLYIGLIKGIKPIKPYYFLNYSKNYAKEFLEKEYGWEYYGEHHHENIYTKFVISYWLPEKFGIDKRIITYSAQILNGDISRAEALNLISKPAYDPESIEKDIEYVLKKLDLSRENFEKVFKSDNNYFPNYPSYYPMIKKYSNIGLYISKKIFENKPGIFEAIDQGI